MGAGPRVGSAARTGTARAARAVTTASASEAMRRGARWRRGGRERLTMGIAGPPGPGTRARPAASGAAYPARALEATLRRRAPRARRGTRRCGRAPPRAPAGGRDRARPRHEPPFGSVGMAASRRSILANGSAVPDRSRAGIAIARPVRDPRPGRLGRARPVQRVAQADERRVRPAAGSPVGAAHAGRRERGDPSAERVPADDDARLVGHLRLERLDRVLGLALGQRRARAPRGRGRAGPRPRAPSRRPCPTRRARGRPDHGANRTPAVACWYGRQGRGLVPSTHGRCVHATPHSGA